MLTLQEKTKIKEILSQGLNINRNINFPYFLDAIDETNKKIKNLESELNRVIYNQRVLDQKLDVLINLCRKLASN